MLETQHLDHKSIEQRIAHPIPILYDLSHPDMPAASPLPNFQQSREKREARSQQLVLTAQGHY